MKKITINELSKIDLTNKIICFPTDTVYGVAARIDDILAVLGLVLNIKLSM